MTKTLGCQHLLLSHSWWAFDRHDTDDTDGEPFGNCYQMERHTASDATVPPPGTHPTDTLLDVHQRDVQGWTRQPHWQCDLRAGVRGDLLCRRRVISMLHGREGGAQHQKQSYGCRSGHRKGPRFKRRALQLRASGRTPPAKNIRKPLRESPRLGRLPEEGGFCLYLRPLCAVGVSPCTCFFIVTCGRGTESDQTPTCSSTFPCSWPGAGSD